MTREHADDTEAEARIRKSIVQNCESFGVPPQEAKEIADRVIRNLRKGPKPPRPASVNTDLVNAQRPSPSQAEQPSNEIVFKLLKQWNDLY